MIPQVALPDDGNAGKDGDKQDALGQDAGRQKIEVRHTTGGNSPGTGKHLSEDEQPQCRLHRPRQQFGRVVTQFANLHFGNCERLLKKMDAQGQERYLWRQYMASQAAEWCASFLQFHDSFLLILASLPRSERIRRPASPLRLQWTPSVRQVSP